MSTYNGSKYLREQIDSILSQENVDVNLIIRDDGSRDDTISILESYQTRGLLTYTAGENLGYAGSFLKLLKEAPPCDYYAFSDQDDIWLSEKLRKAVDSLKKSQGRRILYCSNLLVYHNEKVIGVMRPIESTTDKYKCLNKSICTGCTIVINKEFRDYVLGFIPDKVKVHDLWLFHTAVFLGTLLYDNNAYIMYRQHGSNQIGAKYSRVARMRNRIKSLRTLPQQHEKEEEAKLLMDTFKQELKEEDKPIIAKVANYKYSLWNKLLLLFDSRYETSFFDKARIVFGVY